MSPKRILLADDDCLMTHILRLKMEEAGYVVDVVRDGLEGLERARECPPDMVITDLQMPGMDGYGFACALREDPATSSVPIVLLTGRGHKLSAEQIAGSGIVQVVPKPFSAREILRIVQAQIGTEFAA